MTIFEKIIARELPAKIVYEDEYLIAFEDIKPKAPIHVLLVPKITYATLEDVPIDSDLQQKLLVTARKIAAQLGTAKNYTLHLNVGLDLQQVPHLHLHLCGGWDKQEQQKLRQNG